MSFSLLPKVLLYAVTDITPERLASLNIRLLMMDFDNTILPYTTSVPEEKVIQWLNKMKDSGIFLCVVSNSKKRRVVDFCEKYCLDYVTDAAKPSKRGILLCLRKYAVRPQEAAIVGDQIFTDTLGGNRCGVTTILVQSISNHTFLLKLRHIAELPFIFIARKRRNL